MTYVLVHGGGFDGRCWDKLVPLLDGPAFAVDLPGRHVRSDEAAPDLTIADFADAVVDIIESKQLTDVVLVGHSLAGVTLPAVAKRVPERLARLVFVAASVPADGQAVADVLDSFSPGVAEIAAGIDDSAWTGQGTLHPDIAKALFCNDMTDDDIDFTLSRMVAEAYSIIAEPVDLGGLGSIPRTYVRLLRDQSVLLESQDRMIANLGGPDVVDVVDIDSSHMVMINRPEALAEVLKNLA